MIFKKNNNPSKNKIIKNPKHFFSALFLLFISSQSISSTQNSDYCIAIRGNGELIPAHFGALENAIETFGFPKAIAGTSSASISSFLVSSLSQNTLLLESRTKQESAMVASLFLKSIEPILMNSIQPEKLQFLAQWVSGKIKNFNDGDFQKLFSLAGKMQIGKNLSSEILFAKELLQNIVKSKIFTGPAVLDLLAEAQGPAANTPQGQLRIKNRIIDIQRSLSVIGKFDAKNDSHLLLRSGVINFRELSRNFSYLADYLSLRGAKQKELSLARNFVSTCGDLALGKTWIQLVNENHQCEKIHKDLVQAYFQSHNPMKNGTEENEVIGSKFLALAGTAVIKDVSANKLRDLKKSYYSNFLNLTEDKHTEFFKNFGSDFSLNNEDLLFGYWGPSQILKTAEFNLLTKSELREIDKSKRFFSLGSARWKDILSLSPAEPGLSSYLEIGNGNNPYVSVGGWSDLHPIPVLKSAGCERVVYLTRKGGDSLFAQGLVKRLMAWNQPDWTLLEGKNQEAQNFNPRGSIYLKDKKLPVNPQWQKMYDLNFPNSNFAASLKLADAVLCTDWNRFDVFTDTKAVPGLINDAYSSSWYLTNNKPEFIRPFSQVKTINDQQKKSDYSLSGCVPIN